MPILQKEIKLRAYSRGFHIITREIEGAIPELKEVEHGLLHIFIKHSSASLTINENADPTVRMDMEEYMDRIVPENAPYFRHTIEGPDDMPAHIKTSFMGAGVMVPVTKGRMNLGTWQGIYLGEHRNHGGERKVVLTLWF